MTKQLHQTIARWVLGLLVSTVLFGPANAATLLGAYTIDASQAASSTNFQNLSSAITFLTSAGARSDGGPANSAPFGVGGQVTFNYTAGTGPYNEQVVIPVITGASPTNNIIINGNGCTMQFNTSTNYALLRLNGADHITINNLKFKTTSTTNCIGIQFMSNADSNTVYGCTVDLTAITGWSYPSAGIAFSSDLYSGVGGGANGYYNTIMNDTILNSLTGGPYYCVTNYQSTNGTVSANKFIGNLIDNIGYIGYYSQNTNGTLIKNNEFRSTTKTSILSTRQDIYLTSNHTNDSIIGNRMHDPMGTLTSTTIGYQGIYAVFDYNTIITNNRIYDIKCNWDIFPIYLYYSSNPRVYHNTISLDHTASTVGSAQFSYGLYTASASGVDFRNNIISITRGGTSTKVPVYLSTTGTYTINNNDYYVTGQNANIGFNNGALYNNLSSWKAANYPYDTSTYTLNPRFTAATNFTPQEAMLNNAGANLLAYAPLDANNNARTSTPDIGAFEFSPSGSEDAGVISLTAPSIPFNAGSYPVSAKIKNAGLNTLTSVSINWSVNGVLQSPFSWTGSLNPTETSGNIVLGNYAFATGVNHTIRAWTSNPNGTTDASASNDSTTISNILTTMLGGTYTINAGSSASPTNFTSFTSLSNSLSGGITGPVIVNVVSSSGPYTEQVAFNAIPGVSATNNVVINGNSNTLQFSATATNYAQLRLNGAKHLTIQNLTVKALNNTYSWGLHFINNADSNKIINCNFDLTTNISTSTYSVGIVFSNSLTNPTTGGANGRGNLISGCNVTGSTTGGHYYGITHFPTSSYTTPSNNKFINNVIENFYNYGIFAQNTNGTLYKGNTIRNTNRTTFTTIYGIYNNSGSMSDTIINNIIENPFGTITTTSEFAGIFIANPSTPTTNPNLIANNIIRNVRSNGVQYGIRGTAIGNTRIYHNTIIIDNPTSTSASTTYGIFSTGAPVANGLEIKNNVVYINRPVTNTNYNIYLASASANYAINNNLYYKSAAAGNIGYYAGTVCNTMSQWQAVNGSAFDAAGKSANPYFTNIVSNSIPRDGSLNAAGANVLAYVATDFAGNARSATPDIGAYEFTPAAVDAGIDAIVPPASPFNAGSLPVNVRIRNGGTSTLTSATVNWRLNGVLQSPFSWTGSIASGAVSANVNIGNGTFAGAINNTIVAWTSAPNGGTDGLIDNDSATVSGIYTSLAAGTYTIDKNSAASATNFTSFTAAATSLNLGGISGAVTFNVVAGSGPYTEQVTLNNIPGATSATKVTINGNNQELNFNNTVAAAIHIIGLNNTKHLVLNNLRIRSLNATYGAGIILSNSSDSNIIQGCSIDISSITGTTSTASAGIAFSGSFGSVATTAASTGAANLIQNNTIDGGASNGCYYGIIVNATNATVPTYSHNRIIGNTVKDFYNYGIYLAYSTRAAIKKNVIYRPTKSVPSSFYGIYVASGSQADTIESNLIYQPYGAAPTNTSTVYGIQFSSTSPDVATPSIIKNNLITDFKGAGSMYGISNSTNQYIKIYHNTINISDLTSTSSSLTYGIHSTGTATAVNIKNNIVNIEKGGSGEKYALYFATTSATGYLTNYNSLRSFGTANANIGYYSAAFNTFANWKTANTNAFDQNSVTANPLFRNQLNALFLEPGNDTLDNTGTNLLSEVPVDYAGNARTATPDMGAYNFLTYPNDAGIFSFNNLGGNSSIIIPVNNTTLPVNVTIKNYGTAQLSSAGISWSLGNVMQIGTTYGGSPLLKGDTAVVSLGNAMLGNGINQIKAWTSNPNGSTDASNLNDTLAIRVCTPIVGDLTINAAWPDTGSNFSSFPGLFSALRGCGVAGPVNIKLGAGTYAQQLTMPNNIPGHSSVNTITFNGGDSALCKITHNAAVSRATLLLDGAKNYIFRNITFIASNTTSATAVQLINSADSNTFFRCAFNVPASSSSAVNPFIASGNLTSFNTGGNACNNLFVDSCSTTGGYIGVTIYGLSATKMKNNVISNTKINDSYNYGLYVFYQNTVKLNGNNIQNIGLSITTGAAYGIYVVGCDSANEVRGNYMAKFNSNGSYYGIYAQNILGSPDKRSVIANNAIDVGTPLVGSTFGLYDYDNGYTDMVYNTVRNNSGDANYNSSSYMCQITNPTTYNNNKVLNNIFISPNGTLSARITSQTNIIAANYVFNNNIFYSSGVYPFNVTGPVANYITTTLLNFTTSPNMIGGLVGNNTNSLFMLPQFDARLKSLSYQLDGGATPVSTVTVDIDNNPRHVTTPDIGAFEFDKLADDIGVVSILTPSKPLQPGINDIKVVIRNFGLNTLTTATIGYQIGATLHTLTYAGNLTTLSFDTVTFTSTSGPSGGSQQYNFTGITETIKVWTSMPNGVVDLVATNDTATNTLCTGIAGSYTIDPAGSGPNNFTTIQAALNKLNCGGVYGHVVFNIAPGTYAGQYLIPTLIGTSDTSTITFRAANGIASSVKLTHSPAAAASNYVFYLQGVKYVNFSNLTLENTNTTNGRVIVLGTNTATNITTSNIVIRNSVISSPVVTSTSDLNALIYTNAANVTQDINVINNTLTGGSMGVFASGPNIVNQFSANLTVDSNTFNDQYYYSIYMNNRSAFKIRKNTINMTASAYYGIYSVTSGAQSIIADNNITSNGGSGYGISINSHAFYNLAGEISIRNNSINFIGGSGTQYGIGLASSSYIDMLNNSVRLGSSSTSYGVYTTGHAPFVQAGTNMPGALNITLLNNIFNVQSGYAVYNYNAANPYADSAMIKGQLVNRNLYYSGTSSALYIQGSTYDAANFAAYRNLLYAGSDLRSNVVNVGVTSPTNIKPNQNNASIWYVNGGAQRSPLITRDVTGVARSSSFAEGTPDIGAYEVTPMTEPNDLTIVGTPTLGGSQFLFVNGDTAGWITWGYVGTLPTSITAKFYPGSYVSHPAQYPTGSIGDVLDEHWKITPTGGSGYTYDLKLRYDANRLGTIPSESDIRLANKESGPSGYWVPASFTNTILDTIEKTYAGSFLYFMHLHTATTDMNPLPVKLTSFVARKEKNNGVLNWITAMERNAARFEVERSEDGASFAKIGEVKAAGNTSSNSRYSFTDNNVINNIRSNQAFYRLKMVNRDGSFEYSEVRSISFDENGTTVAVYPNPFNGTLSIELNAEITKVDYVVVTDVYGKEVMSLNTPLNGSNKITLDQMSGLATGVYIVKSKINNVEYTHKVVKQ